LSLLLRGMAEASRGNAELSLRLIGEAVDMARTFGQGRELAVALQTLGTVLLDQGDRAAAGAVMRESLEALRDDPSYLFICRGIEYLAAARAEEAPEVAARWVGAAETLRRHIGAD